MESYLSSIRSFPTKVNRSRETLTSRSIMHSGPLNATTVSIERLLANHFTPSKVVEKTIAQLQTIQEERTSKVNCAHVFVHDPYSVARTVSAPSAYTELLHAAYDFNHSDFEFQSTHSLSSLVSAGSTVRTTHNPYSLTNTEEHMSDGDHCESVRSSSSVENTTELYTNHAVSIDLLDTHKLLLQKIAPFVRKPDSLAQHIPDDLSEPASDPATESTTQEKKKRKKRKSKKAAQSKTDKKRQSPESHRASYVGSVGKEASHHEGEVKVFVGNLFAGVTQPMLSEMFAGFGDLLEAFVFKNSVGPYASRGVKCAFVRFRSMDSAQRAIDALNGKPVKGHDLVVEIAHARQAQAKMEAAVN